MNATADGLVGEELRETLIAMSRELELLRTEARHANLLLGALDSMLVVDRHEDPFAAVFAAVHSIFGYSHALALVETASSSSPGLLECVSASHEGLVGTHWPIDRMLAKAL